MVEIVIKNKLKNEKALQPINKTKILFTYLFIFGSTGV
jgi:hypothetical protein